VFKVVFEVVSMVEVVFEVVSMVEVVFEVGSMVEVVFEVVQLGSDSEKYGIPSLSQAKCQRTI